MKKESRAPETESSIREHLPSGECCEACNSNFFANRCIECGTKLPCSLEKYLSGRNGQFRGSDESVYERLHVQ
jgi:hypothetical protein